MLFSFIIGLDSGHESGSGFKNISTSSSSSSTILVLLQIPNDTITNILASSLTSFTTHSEYGLKSISSIVPIQTNSDEFFTPYLFIWPLVLGTVLVLVCIICFCCCIFFMIRRRRTSREYTLKGKSTM